MLARACAERDAALAAAERVGSIACGVAWDMVNLSRVNCELGQAEFIDMLIVLQDAMTTRVESLQ